MTINKITIENIKGIEARTFNVGIIPNKPSLLVAPNGFGKSSIVAAFMCLQSNRLNLSEEYFYKGEAGRPPKLLIEYIDESGVSQELIADSTSNSISNYFDCFVINNQLKAKGTRRTFGGRTVVSASMGIEPITLINNIPKTEQFGYSYAQQKALFGTNGKILPNIGDIFENSLFIQKISTEFSLLDRLLGTRVQARINQFKQEMNVQPGSTDVLRLWMATNKIIDLDQIAQLKELAELVLSYNTALVSRELAYLGAIEIIQLYEADKTKFKEACRYSNYLFERKTYTELITGFNSSWCEFAPRESDKKLILQFPKLQYISNGQRDVLSFVALLIQAKKALKNNNSILIIDEVFDYLDDANLIAVQYYISHIIEEYRNKRKRLYPLIFTHLNPNYFKNFTFSKQKIYFLNTSNINQDQNFIDLLKKRTDPSIKDDVSKYLLHYHSGNIAKRNEFRLLSLKETWGENDNFDQFIEQEMLKYIADQPQFDPLAICCVVRKRVEKIVYDLLTDPAQKTQFLDTHSTNDKLEYAESKGVAVPEYFYLLGIIHNYGMHWKENHDNITPIASKLQHLSIKNLIKQLYSHKPI